MNSVSTPVATFRAPSSNRSWFFWLGLNALLLLVVAGFAWLRVSATAEISSLNKEQSAAEQKLAGSLARQIQQYSSNYLTLAASQTAIPLDQLLTNLQQNLPQTIQLESISLDPERRLRLAGTASSLSELAALVKRFEASSTQYSGVQLESAGLIEPGQPRATFLVAMTVLGQPLSQDTQDE